MAQAPSTKEVPDVRIEADLDRAGGCHTFERDLRVGDRGEEVRVLHRLLLREGCFIDEGGVLPVYGEKTKAAISDFQSRWRGEIFGSPGKLDLSGNLEGKTRVKFNQLYGCGSPEARGLARSYITVLFPNGGEVWKVGGTYTIRWAMHINKKAGDDNLGGVEVRLRRLDKTSGRELTPSVYIMCDQAISSGDACVWTIPSKVPSTHGRVVDLTDPNVVYRAWVEVITRVFERGTPDYVRDESDATFNILRSSSPPR